jgi:3-hydroxyacyl-CoA dehydrogenase/enoyl-CoA hydratase/3-hydroxybutyryl-CoA epimerase
MADVSKPIVAAIHGATSGGGLGAVFGLGFPPFQGGPFRYIDRLGSQKVLAMLEDLEKKHGSRFGPAQILRDMAAKDGRFYGV